MAFRGPLPVVAGGRLRATVLEVTYAPGGASPPHVRTCPVVAYVARGAVRSRGAGGAAVVYRAGESFIEAPGVTHVTSANASRTAPATLVATVVCDRDARESAGPAR